VDGFAEDVRHSGARVDVVIAFQIFDFLKGHGNCPAECPLTCSHMEVWYSIEKWFRTMGERAHERADCREFAGFARAQTRERQS